MGIHCENYQRVTPRFLSKFNILYCHWPCDETMNHIFETMLCNKMKKYPEDIRCMKEEMSQTCV